MQTIVNILAVIGGLTVFCIVFMIIMYFISYIGGTYK